MFINSSNPPLLNVHQFIKNVHHSSSSSTRRYKMFINSSSSSTRRYNMFINSSSSSTRRCKCSSIHQSIFINSSIHQTLPFKCSSNSSKYCHEKQRKPCIFEKILKATTFIISSKMVHFQPFSYINKFARS